MRPSRFHFPIPLRSTVVSRFLATMGTLIPAPLFPAPEQVSLVHVRELPVVPSPNTPCAPVFRLCFWTGRLGQCFALWAGTGSSDFTLHMQVRQSHQAESSLCRHASLLVFSTDRPFTSSCSPRAIAGPQLLSVNGGKLRHEGTSTLLLTYAPKRTHAAPNGAFRTAAASPPCERCV